MPPGLAAGFPQPADRPGCEPVVIGQSCYLGLATETELRGETGDINTETLQPIEYQYLDVIQG